MNDFRLRRELARVLGVPSPDVTKLRDGSLLIRTPTYSESVAVSGVTTLEGAPIAASLHPSLNMSKGTVYSRNC